MTFNISMLTGRTDVIRTALSRLKDLSRLSQKDFMDDYKNPAAAETSLRHCLEGIFDIGRHILAKMRTKSDLNPSSLHRGITVPLYLILDKDVLNRYIFTAVALIEH